MRSLGTTWQQTGCKGVFGSITKEGVLLGVPDSIDGTDLEDSTSKPAGPDSVGGTAVGGTATPALDVESTTTLDASPSIAAPVLSTVAPSTEEPVASDDGAVEQPVAEPVEQPVAELVAEPVAEAAGPVAEQP